MWCANCQDDVATEISANGQALKCITCGEDVREVFAPSLHPETKSARDLLQRWAEEQKQKLEADAAKPDQPPQPVSENGGSPPSQAASKKSQPEDESSPDHVSIGAESVADSAIEAKNRPKFRIDSAHDELTPKKTSSEKRDERPVAAVASQKTKNQPELEEPMRNSDHQTDTHRTYSSHTSHESPAAPHFDVVAASKKAKSRPGRSEAIWGQLMAYAGVGVLTVGTIMVLWGYFGMVEQYASTGWLLSTAGQMLLLLGIVTLVSGGMQQTTHEVSERIEYLGGRMIRIEQSTDQLLKGPHFADRKTGSEKVSQATNSSNSEA